MPRWHWRWRPGRWPAPPGPGRAAGVALALLQTLPLAVRRWRPSRGAGRGGRRRAGRGDRQRWRWSWSGLRAGGAVLGGRALPAAAGGLGRHRRLGRPDLAACARRRRSGRPQQIGLAAAISLGFPALAWLSGAYVSELRGRAARSRREQELETGRAVAEERARIARELHDVIAHTVSVMVVQAGGRRGRVRRRPEARPAQALATIGATGRAGAGGDAPAARPSARRPAEDVAT